MTVSNRNSDDSSEEVKIFLSIRVKKELVFSFDNQKLIFVICDMSFW